MSEPMGEHFCTGCGQPHGGNTGKDAEVRIAEINAKRDIEVARIQRGEFQTVAATEAETEIAVAELETAAAVEVAAELDAPPAAEEPDTQAIVVEGPPAEPDEPDAPSMEPSDDDAGGEPPEPRKSRGYWP
jgi:hypothetical protein